jgi:hypothetical protein
LDYYMNKCKVFAEQSNSINFVRFEPPAIHTVNDSPLIHSAFPSRVIKHLTLGASNFPSFSLLWQTAHIPVWLQHNGFSDGLSAILKFLVSITSTSYGSLESLLHHCTSSRLRTPCYCLDWCNTRCWKYSHSLFVQMR